MVKVWLFIPIILDMLGLFIKMKKETHCTPSMTDYPPVSKGFFNVCPQYLEQSFLVILETVVW